MTKKEIDETDEEILIVKEALDIADGMHKGHITNVVRDKERMYDYVDVYIDLDDMDASLKTGFPANLSRKSHLGRFLISAGFEIVPNQEVSLKAMKDVLIGRNVECSTYKDDNDYSRIITKTIRFV